MNVLSKTAIVAVAAAALATTSTAAWADPVNVGNGKGTDVFVETETNSYAAPANDPYSFYDLFDLDNVCGFAHGSFTNTVSETFFIRLHTRGAAANDWNVLGQISDEPWTFTAHDADGNVVDVFSGLAEETATSTGTIVDGNRILESSNLRFDGTATDAEGRRLHLQVLGRYRADEAGEITRFDYHVQSCNVTK